MNKFISFINRQIETMIKFVSKNSKRIIKIPKRYLLYIFILALSIWTLFHNRDILSSWIESFYIKAGKLFELLHNYLIYKSDTNPTFISDIFMGMGNTTIGALAIIFSISLFAAQQGYATYSQGAIKIFLKDKKSLSTYIIISVLILFFYGLSVFDKTDIISENIVWFFLLGILGLLFLIIMIFYHYYRVTDIISPSYILKYFSINSIKRLKTRYRYNELDERDNPDSMSESDKERFVEIESLIPSLKNGVEEICNIIKKYRDRREYSIVGEGLSEIVRISAHYINAKKNLFIGSHSELFMIPGAMDIAHDRFFDDLDGVFEKLRHISQISSVDSDIETIRRVILSLKIIAIESLKINYVGGHISENHTFSSCIKNIDIIVRECGESLPDIGIQAAANIDEIISHVFLKDGDCRQMNVMNLLQVGDTISMQGIQNENARFLINKGLKIFLRIMAFSYLTDQLPITRLAEMFIDDHLKIFILLYITNVPDSLLGVDFDIGAPFGDLDDFTIPSIVRSLCKSIELERDGDKRKKLLENLSLLNNTLAKFYRDILEAASKKESSIISYISRDIKSISLSLCSLENNVLTEVSEKKEVLRLISRHISNYWRIYDFHTTISKNYYMLMEEDIFELGYTFHRCGYDSLLKDVLVCIITIAKFFHKKQIDHNEYQVPRILLSALEFALFTDKTDIFLDTLGTMVDSGELTLEAYQWHIFLSEYSSINQRAPFGIRANVGGSISDDVLNEFLPALILFLKERNLVPSTGDESDPAVLMGLSV